MAAGNELKYRAFLCSAYGDENAATWLLRRIKSYALDADIATRSKMPGPKDASGRAKLKPIYPSRYLSMSGSSLPSEVLAALDNSASLVVVCTSMAAGDRSVAEVVRHFKFRHPDRPIIPVVPDKAAGTGLPPALRFALNPDGSVGREPISVTAIDLRESADGKSYGMAKVAAGLLGLGDATPLYRRAHVRESQRSRWTWTTTFAALALALGGATVWGETNREQVAVALATAASQSKLAAEQTAAVEAGHKAVAELQGLGDLKGQAAQLRQAAVDQEKMIVQLRGALEKARQVALAPKSDPGAELAQKALIAKLRADIDDQRKATEVQSRLAEQRRKESEQQRLATASQPGTIEALRRSFDDQRTAIAVQSGLAEQRRMEAEQLRLASADQSGLVERLRKEIDSQRKATETQAATAAEQQALALRLRGELDIQRKATDIQNGLAEQRRKEAEQQRLVAADQLALVERLRKELDDQRKATEVQASLTAQRVAEADGLRKGAEDLKALAARRGQDAAAQQADAEKLQMDADRRLAAVDENADALILTMLQSMHGHPDLIGSVSDSLLSSIEKRADERIDTRSTSPDGLRRQGAIFDDLAALYASRNKGAGQERAVRRSIDVSLRLAEADKGSPDALARLAGSYTRSGDLQVAQSSLADAARSYQAAAFLRERVASADAQSADAQRSLSIAYQTLGGLRAKTKDTSGALASYKSALTAALRLPEPAVSETDHVRVLIALHRTLIGLGDDPTAHRGEILKLFQDLKARGVATPSIKGLSGPKLASAPVLIQADTAAPVAKRKRRALRKAVPADTTSLLFGG